MRTVGLSIGLVILCTLLLACSSTIRQLKPELVNDRFPFLLDGKTSKAEVLGQLGEPFGRYEDGHIFTYNLCVIQCSSSAQKNTLVLVFGPDDLLERHSLVFVK